MIDVPDEFDSPDDHPGEQPAPWIVAGFDGVCSRSGERITIGQDIRADGDGGWECKECVDDDIPVQLDPYRGWMEGDDEPTFGYWEAGDHS